MDCVFHPGRESTLACDECERMICSECTVESRGRELCPECAAAETFVREPVAIDYGRAFSYILDDPGWMKKFAIGGLLTLASIAIIPAFFLLGYQLRVIQRVVAGDDRILPKWERMKEMFVTGAKLFLALGCYALPGIALFAGFTAIGLTVGRGTSARTIYGGLQEGALALFCFLFIAFLLYLLFFRLLMPALIIRFHYTGSAREAIRFGEITRIIKVNPGPYLTVFVIAVLVIVPMSLVGLIACGVGVFFSLFYSVLVDSHLYAQLARISPR